MERSAKGRSLARLIIQLFRANTAFLRAGDELVSGLGLTSARWQVLAVVALSKSALTAPQIGNNLGLTRQGVQQHLHALVEFGYLWPAHNKAHKRSPVYRVSELGQEAFASAELAQTEWLNRLSESCSGEDLTAAELCIRQLLVNMNE